MSKFVKATIAAIGLMSAPAAAQTVEIEPGKVKGQTDANGIASYLGIPYAAPPTGENRWRAPQPVEAWDGVFEASDYGNVCAQNIYPPNMLPPLTAEPSEDCLYLNVWAPPGAKPGDNLPVMFWVHGGGFTSGGNSTPAYSGHNFARDGVVFVSINYRVARFGFFAHPALKAEEDFGGNFGFLDQIAGLQWVQDNIASFGGDPERVTIFGESAGGGAIHMLLQSPLARGKFSGAIIQSGGGRAAMGPQMTKAKAAGEGEKFAPGASAADLRALPVDEIVGGLGMGMGDNRGYSGPMLDGRTMLGAPLDAAGSGLYADVPIMLGGNSADGFVMGTDKDKIFAGFGANEAEARQLYDPDGTKGGLEVAVQTSADFLIREPARAVARVLAAKGRDVWLFRFEHNGTIAGQEMGGAPHAAEIPYVFDVEEVRRQPLDTGHDAEVAGITHAYWVNFAKTGNPNGAGPDGSQLPAWPRATPDTTTVQLIDTRQTAHVEDPLTAQLDLRERMFEAE